MPGIKTYKSQNRYIADEISSVLCAYGLKKLKSSYTGNCIDIRRSSDSAYQTIGFSGDNIDTAAITSFVGANSGYVRYWYDQVGSYNFGQTTTANQPRLVNAGTIDSNGLMFVDSTDSMTSSDIAASTIGVAIGFKLGNTPANNTDNYVIHKNNYNEFAINPQQVSSALRTRGTFADASSAYHDVDGILSTSANMFVINDFSGSTHRIKVNGGTAVTQSVSGTIKNGTAVWSLSAGYSSKYIGNINFVLMKTGAFTNDEIKKLEVYNGY
jgi:hypothetical protein